MNPQAGRWRGFATTGRELIKPVVHAVGRSALPLVERAAGVRYIRKRHQEAAASRPGAQRTTAGPEAKAAASTAGALKKLARQIGGTDLSHVDGRSVAPTDAEVAQLTKQLRRMKAAQSLAGGLSRGESLSSAAVTTSRALLAAGAHEQVVAMGLTLSADPDQHQTGAAVLGIAYGRSSGPVSAWSQFERLEDAALRTAAADEYYTSALDVLGTDAIPLLTAARDAGETAGWSGAATLRIAQAAFTLDAFDIVEQLLEDALGSREALPAPVAAEMRRLLTWLPDGSARPVRGSSATVRNFGIINYDQPGIRSRNVGDYVQTLASIGHLLRDRSLRYSGDDDLVELFDELSASVKPQRGYAGTDARLNLVEVQRDGNIYQDIPQDTWFFAFGWLMHDTFGRRYNIPFHDHLRPILLSVYIRYPEMLTEEVIDYLKRYGPVGCRDWQSVALLHAVGVPAFFSGCLTTTVDTLFPEREVDERSGTIRIDWQKDRKTPSKRQTVEEIRDKSLTENVRIARDWVGDYAYTYRTVLTSRLHANLPARSVGATVEFEPKNRSDMRFGGLYGISDDEFDAIRTGILSRLRTMLALIASGADEEEIYRTWREITADDVERSRARVTELSLPTADEAEVTGILEGVSVPDHDEERLEIVLADDASDSESVRACARSIDRTLTGGFRLWIPAEAAKTVDVEALSSDLRHGVVEFLPALAIPGVTRQEDAVRACLPRLFPHHDRVLLLPGTAEARGDLSTFVRQDLGDHLLAATTDVRSSETSLLAHLRKIAARYRDRHDESLAFVFATHAAQSGDSRPFDPRSLVLNLEEFRARNLVPRLLGVIRDYGIGFEDAVLLLAGGDYLPVGGEWSERVGLEFSDTAMVRDWSSQHRLREQLTG